MIQRKKNFDAIRDARMAQAAYDANGTQSVLGYARVSQSALQLENPDIQLVNQKTGFKSALFTDGSKYFYAVAGTDMNESKEAKLDWLGANIPQAFGSIPAQYVQAKENAESLNDMYGENLSFTGHSLGGSLASLQSLVTGRPATTFNAAPLHQNTLDRFNVRNPSENQIAGFYVQGEILDDATRFGQKLGMPLYSFNNSPLRVSSLDSWQNIAGALGTASWLGKAGVGYVKTMKHDLSAVIGALYNK